MKLVEFASILAFGSAAVVGSFSSPVMAADNFSAAQKAEIEQIVHQYLVQKPEVLIEASEALQQKQMVEIKQKAAAAITDNAKALFSDVAPSVGATDGKIVMVEFLDYQCPHCKKMAETIDKLVAANKDLKVIYRPMPIFGASSEMAVRAALASVKQDKFAAFHDALLKIPSRLNKNLIMKAASDVGIDTEQLQKDMREADITNQIRQTYQLSQMIGIAGTPAYIVANTDDVKASNSFIPGAASEEDLQAAITKAQKG